MTPKETTLSKEINIPGMLMVAATISRFSKEDQDGNGTIAFHTVGANDERACVHSKYVKDAIDSLLKIGYDRLFVHTSIATSPIVISGDEVYNRENTLAIIMPMRDPGVYSQPSYK